MDIEHFVKTVPGSDVVSKELEDGSGMAIIGAIHPDVVTMPPDLGGQTVRVLKTEAIDCPGANCNGRHIGHYLENDYIVVECPHLGFLWCKRG